MDISIRTSTIEPMLNLCKKHLNGLLSREELEDILSDPDYEIEFKRYSLEGLPMCNITKDEFIDFFMNIFNIKINDIKNERLKIRYESLMKFFSKIDFYESYINYFLKMDKDFFISKLLYTFNGLPKEICFDNINILFTISIGNSCGWPYEENYVHFDIIQLIDFGMIDKGFFGNYLAHELHHIGFNKFMNMHDFSNINLEEQLVQFLAFEGLAVKYCNNGEGPLTKSLYDECPNNGMDDFTWEYFKNDFYRMFRNFKEQIYSIRSSNMSYEDFCNIINDYWLCIYTDDQDKSEFPKLKHTRNYYFGCNIWGLIHDVYGQNTVYDTLKNPSTFIKVFNDALTKMNKNELII